MTVRRRLGHRIGPQNAAGTGFVVDDDGLPQRARQANANRARQHVSGPAGWKGNNDSDRLGRKILGRCRAASQCKQGKDEMLSYPGDEFHDGFPAFGTNGNNKNESKLSPN